VADARRSVSRKYGFRQSSYINFKVEGGYFFCLYFLTGEARLTVKPMYADDLWWDIWDASENKKEPLSLRGTGAYSLSGQVLASYEIAETTDADELTNAFDDIFKDANTEVTGFLTDNPDADLFYPDESRMNHDPDRLLYLMALIHNDKKEDALEIIKEARKNKHRCMFQSGMFSDSYTYISRWCKRKSLFRLFTKWTLKHFNCSDVSENGRRVSVGREAEKCKRKPWYRLFPEWVYWLTLAPVYVPVAFYFFDLHKRTLCDIPWWIWFVGSSLIAAYILIGMIRNGLRRKGLLVGLLMSITFGTIYGMMAVGSCIGLFEGINRLFASEPIEVSATVTYGKFHHRSIGRWNFNWFITIVQLKPENVILKIDDYELYKVPPQSEVIITYRHGLFGIDIFDSFSYPPE